MGRTSLPPFLGIKIISDCSQDFGKSRESNKALKIESRQSTYLSGSMVMIRLLIWPGEEVLRKEDIEFKSSFLEKGLSIQRFPSSEVGGGDEEAGRRATAGASRQKGGHSFGMDNSCAA